MVIQTPKNWWGQRASCCCWKTFIALALPCSGPRIGLLCATCFLRLCARVACLIQCTLSQLLRSVTHCYFEWVMFQLFHFVFGITLARIFFVRYDCILHLCPVFLLASKMCCIFSLLFFFVWAQKKQVMLDGISMMEVSLCGHSFGEGALLGKSRFRQTIIHHCPETLLCNCCEVALKLSLTFCCWWEVGSAR